jgi:hypothetical protein
VLTKLRCVLAGHTRKMCRCLRCGDVAHTWNGCRCVVCSIERDHEWRGPFCAQCGATAVTCSYCSGLGKYLGQPAGVRFAGGHRVPDVWNSCYACRGSGRVAGRPADQAPLSAAQTPGFFLLSTLGDMQNSSVGHSADDLRRVPGSCAHEPDKTLPVGDVRCKKCGTLLGRGRL